MSGFILDLATLPTGASRVVLESGAVELDLPPAEWREPVRGEFGVERNGDQVSVRGRLVSAARLECVRCLAEFSLPIAVPFEVFAERAGSSRHRGEEADLERDSYMQFHDGRLLDLRVGARETLLLELPLSPHCREDCAGLCPRCGADLNHGPCGCPS
jgi:uncharacterized protein